MNIEIAVQEKQSLLEEAKMNSQMAMQEKEDEIESQRLKAEILREEERKKLVSHQSENTIQASKAKGEALRLELNALAGLSPELLEVLAANQMNSQQIVSRAMRDLAKNAQKIGNLNISPDLLNSLLEKEQA